MTVSTREQPVFFPAGDDMLFGVHTHPAAPARGVAIIMIQGGDLVNAALSRNHIGVRMARELADDGYDVFRFTYHGVGESTGVVERLHLHEPFTDDVVGAADYLRGQGLDRFVLMGSCFGSRTALSSAPLIPETVGLVLATPPSAGYDRTQAMAEYIARNRSLGEYVGKALTWEKIRELFDRGKRRTYVNLARKKVAQVGRQLRARVTGDRSGGEYDWVSPKLVEPLATMVDRQVPVLFSFGTHDQWLAEFRQASQGPLAPILERGAETIEIIDDLPGVAHGLVRVRVQEAFRETTIDWLHRRVPGAR